MLSAKCVSCLINRQLKMLAEFDDEEKKARYMKDVLSILHDMGPGEAAPVAVERMDSLFLSEFGKIRNFDAVKTKFNALILERENEIYSSVQASEDKLLTALKFARIGNYIDFGALANVEEEKLTKLIEDAPSDELDPLEYSFFRSEISEAERMVYIPDNCGEIVFDKILIRVITEEYPNLDLRVIVRGKPVLNDATQEDAHFVGIDSLCPVIGNGNGIAGTFIPKLSEEAKNLIFNADLILAKGQGNFETMFGCGLNVYYAFLCKCEWFERRFGMKMLEGVFANERRRAYGVTGSSL